MRLTDGEPSPWAPSWIHAEREEAPPDGEPPAGAGARDGFSLELAETLWTSSPPFRGPGDSLAEFLAAGALAVLHPDPGPPEARGQLDVVVGLVRDRPSPLHEVATLRSEALERWLQVTMHSPDRFAEVILIQRIADSGEAEIADQLQFLFEAEVPSDDPRYTELAIDRLVLRGQASAWRYVEGRDFAAALVAVQSWRQRYTVAYGQHYSEVMGKLDRWLRWLERIRAEFQASGYTLEHPYPEHVAIIAAVLAVWESSKQVPREPDRSRAVTAGVTLGGDLPQYTRLRESESRLEKSVFRRAKQLQADASRVEFMGALIKSAPDS